VNLVTAPALRRGLGLRSTTAVSAGLAFAAIDYLGAVTVAIFVAGTSAWLAILVAGLLCLLAAFAFSELNSLYPTAAAIRLYMRNSMDDRVALTITFTYMTTIILIIAADAFIVGRAVQYVLFPGQVFLSLPIIAALIGLAVAANLRGVRMAGNLQEAVTYGALAVTLVVSVLAMALRGFPLSNPITGLFGAGSNPVLAVVYGVFLFSAFEWVTTTAEEARRPSLVPKGMFLSLALLYVGTAAFTMALTAYFPDHGALRAVPYPQLVMAQRALGAGGLVAMFVATGLTAMNTFNGGFLTASRFIYAAAREGNLPRALSRLNVNAVPWMPVVALGAISLTVAALVYLTGAWLLLVSVGAALEATIYAVAAYCVIMLRRRRPEAVREVRMPLGYVTPVVTLVVFGGLALLAAFSDPNNPSGFSIVPVAILTGLTVASALYVTLGIPRLRARAVAAAPRRRPSRLPPSGS